MAQLPLVLYPQLFCFVPTVVPYPVFLYPVRLFCIHSKADYERGKLKPILGQEYISQEEMWTSY